MPLLINNKSVLEFQELKSKSDVIHLITSELNIKPEDYYLVYNGKKYEEGILGENDNIHIIPRLLAGKGGFGSMLRAIGAQIEKTTNREACRDLSGRRLRDINEEKRLKNWINTQADREKEAKERKKKKLERLCELPKHEFKDETYDKERSTLPESVEDAITHGLQASGSSKRENATKGKEIVKKKKPKLWVDDDMDDLSSSNDEASEKEDQKEENSNNSNDSKTSSEEKPEESKNGTSQVKNKEESTKDDEEKEKKKI
ncbi:unnamed protein product [Brassicogethes aeneus]|uniref:SDE2-like domain-containing protein n=1 Tax=Brassicogethes aeneus TaxID=1431903 RepID=A0A9P0FEB0_BRAAE|nr:unnamed protein product [Brassicogethes aeneus]